MTQRQDIPLTIAPAPARRRRPSWRLPTGMRLVNLLLGGWTGVVLLFLYLPVALLVIYSFNRSALNVVWEGFTFHWYADLGLDWYLKLALSQSPVARVLCMLRHVGAPQLPPAPPLIGALNNSLIVAAAATLLSVPLGTGGAWLLYRYRFPGSRLIDALLFIPVVIPEIIMGVSLLIFFAAVGGALNHWLALLGVKGKPVGLGYTTVIIAHVTFCFPFVLIAVRARLAGADPALEEAAMDLGATPMKAFWKVMVPYLMPAIVSGALMAFTLSMDELIVTYFTTGPNSVTLPRKFYGMIREGLNPELNAISALFIGATAVLAACSQYVRKFEKRGESDGNP